MEVLIAARLGDTETASALLAAGADVNGRNDQGCVTRLQVRAPEGRVMTKGSSRRSTALQLACLFGHTQTAEMLVAIGADFNSKDTVGCGQRGVPLRRAPWLREGRGMNLQVHGAASRIVERPRRYS